VSQIIIRLGDDDQTLDLKFEVLDTAIGQRWLDQVRMFVALGSPFDDRERFYNFPNSKFTRDYCENHVRKHLDTQIGNIWTGSKICSDLAYQTL